jgi:hypothetical protein
MLTGITSHISSDRSVVAPVGRASFSPRPGSALAASVIAERTGTNRRRAGRRLEVRKDEVVALGFVRSASRAVPFEGGVTVEEHYLALTTESPVGLRGRCCLHIVGKDKVEALGYVRSASGATSFTGATVVEHCLALIAEAPVRLCRWRPAEVVRQQKCKSHRKMRSADRAVPFTLISVEKHRVTLFAEPPIRLARGFSYYQVSSAQRQHCSGSGL